MRRSPNGWTVINSTQLDRKPFPGTKIIPVPGVRKGDVATVLHYVGSEFNKKVERLKNPGCWGWANRRVLGFWVISNHASGTAIDLNAPQHPQFRRGTFSASQVREIRKILKFCDGVVRWGGDYRLRKDEMHFEINATSGRVDKLAEKIKRGSKPKSTKKYYIVKRGDTIYKISKRYGTTISKIKRLNPNIKDVNLVYPGQKVRVK